MGSTRPVSERSDGGPEANGNSRDARRRGRWRSHERRRETLVRLGRCAVGDVPLAAVLDGAVRSVRDTLEVACADVRETASDGRVLRVRAADGWPDDGHAPLNIPATEGSFGGRALQSAEPLVVDDLRRERRFRTPAELVEQGLRSALAVAIEGEDRPVGVLAAYARRRRRFSRQEIAFVHAVAHLVATAIQRRRAERARAELRRRERHARQQVTTVLDTITEAFFAIDADGRITYLNHPAERYFEESIGKGPAELLGQELWTAAPALARSRFQEEYQRAAAARQPTEFEAYFAPLARWFEVRAYPAEGDGYAVFFRDVTARREAERRERALAREQSTRARAEAARREMKSLLESITDGFLAVDREWRITYLNRRAAEILQRPREALRGRVLWDELPDSAELYDGCRRALAAHAPTRVEFLHAPIDAWFEVHIYPAHAGVSVFFQDITRRKRAEDARERLAAILEATPDFVATTDTRGRLLYLNGAARRMLGIGDDASAIGRPISEFQPQWAGGTVLREGLPTALRSGVWSGETAIRRADDGRDVPVEQVIIAHTAPNAATDGPVRFLSTVMRDLTGQKKNEEVQRLMADLSKVLSAELESDKAMTALAELLVPTFCDFCWIDLLEDGGVNRIAFAHADPEEEKRLERICDHIPDGARPVGMSNVLQTGQPELVGDVSDAWLWAATGAEEHYRLAKSFEPRSIMIVPLVARGHTLGAVLMASSGSGRRYTAADLGLAREIAARAGLACDNARLYEQALRAMRLRDEVLGVVSHDLRNPLNTVRLAAGMMREVLPAEANEQAEPHLRRIDRSVDQSVRMIHDLLDVATAEAGQLRLQRERHEAGLLIEEAVETHRPLAESKSIRLESLVRTDAPVWADRDRVARVFANLISNALSFTPSGGQIRIGAERVGDEVSFFVSDTGPGIPEQMRARLFEPFWQGASERREGAGLGLAIVRGVVEAHGGRVDVESEMGRGSTFRFTLPVWSAGT